MIESDNGSSAVNINGEAQYDETAILLAKPRTLRFSQMHKTYDLGGRAAKLRAMGKQSSQSSNQSAHSIDVPDSLTPKMLKKRQSVVQMTQVERTNAAHMAMARRQSMKLIYLIRNSQDELILGIDLKQQHQLLNKKLMPRRKTTKMILRRAKTVVEDEEDEEDEEGLPSARDSPCDGQQLRPILTHPMSLTKRESSASSSRTDLKNGTLQRRNKQQPIGKLHDLTQLFTAVEQDDIGTVRSLLQRTKVNVNGENADGLRPLDVACMLQHSAVATMLLRHGAHENETPSVSSLTGRLRKLQCMMDNAQCRLAECQVAVKALPAQRANELDKQLSFWESRMHICKKMRCNTESTKVPVIPCNAQLLVSSATSLVVQIDLQEPSTSQPAVTSYKIEWSKSEDFIEIEGSQIVRDLRNLHIRLNSLESGQCYFVRVSAGNLAGFGNAVGTQPPSAIPSSWRQVDSKAPRTQMQRVGDLFHEVNSLRQTDSWRKLFPGSRMDKKNKRTSFKNLFLGGNKFHKTLKKGIYLATILYKDERVVSTVDDNLPIVLVTDSESRLPPADFNWMMKLSCAWDDGLWIQPDNQQVTNNVGSLNMRVHLFDAAAQMQYALGVTDIGRLHHRSITDSNGVTILLTIAHVMDMKSVQGLAVKWVSTTKFLRKRNVVSNTTSTSNSSSALNQNVSALDRMSNDIVDLVSHYEASYIPLDRGLYVCYMKLHASMQDIGVVVPENLPSVLPFVYIRENPHVSREEWDWLSILSGQSQNEGQNNEANEHMPSNVQRSFHWSLVSAARILLTDLDISNSNDHRVYRYELIEVHPDINFILIVPPVAEVCAAPSQQASNENEVKRGCLVLPVTVFETAHLCTYQPELISIYCRLSTFLEYYTLVVQQRLRECLHDTQGYRQQLDTLNVYQQRLDELWRSARWISDVASTARDRSIDDHCSIKLSTMINYTDGRPPPVVDVAHVQEDNLDIGYHSDQSTSGTEKPSTSNSVANQGYMNLPSISDTDAAEESLDGLYVNSSVINRFAPTTTKVNLRTNSMIRRAAKYNSFIDAVKPAPTIKNVLLNTNVANTDKIELPTVTKKVEYVNLPPVKRNSSSDSEHTDSSCSTSIAPNTESSSSVASILNSGAVGKKHALIEDLSSIDKLYTESMGSRTCSTPARLNRNSPSTSTILTNQRFTNKNQSDETQSAPPAVSDMTAIMRVYAAYTTGLPRGTSVKLQLTMTSTTRQVIDLVVQQLNQAAANKLPMGQAPHYPQNTLNDFCLVVVIGARERCLRDDFCLLKLQNPWLKGRLYVRKRDDILAALEFGNEALV